MAIVFKTPGAIPLDAFTTFGINTKPNTKSPIGFFGTGLKYAVAVLCRLGVEVEVWSGDTCYVFYASTGTFRDKEFNFVRMKRKHGTLSKWVGHAKLPFTTELGKNWELWQVFRELESNTRDELGQSFEFDEGGEHELTGQPEYSLIIVRGQAFADVYAARDKVFLPGAVASAPGEVAQVFDVENTNLYYRGLRVFTMPKPSVVTWNILGDMQLTEDRTLASQYMAAYYAARHVVRSTNKDFIRKVLKADDKHWEHSFDYNTSVEPTPEFLEVARVYGRSSQLGGYMSMYDPAPKKKFDDWRLELLDVLVPVGGDPVNWTKVNDVQKVHVAKLVDVLRQSYDTEFPRVVETLDSVLTTDAAGNVVAAAGALAFAGADYTALEAHVLAQAVDGHVDLTAGYGARPLGEEPMATWATQAEIDAGMFDEPEHRPMTESELAEADGVPETIDILGSRVDDDWNDPLPHPDFPAAVAAVKADEDDPLF